MQALPIITEILLLVDQAYKSLIGILWIALINYGLSPHYAFLIPFTTYKPYLSLENALINGFYFQFAVIVTLVVIMVALISNSFLKPKSLTLIFIRVTAAVVLGAVSFYSFSWGLSMLDSTYASVYYGAHLNWSNYLLFSSGLEHQGDTSILQSSISLIVQFFTLSAYFVSVVSLFTILMLRQALMLFSLLIVPLATVLTSLDIGKRYGKVIWEILIEMSAYPFIVIASLFLAHIFNWDAPLQLAFLFIPSLLPGILFTTGRSFLSAPIMGFLGELSLSGAASKGFGSMAIASDLAHGGSFSKSIKDTMAIPLSENSFPGTMTGGKKDNEMPWKDLLSEELKYRKE